MKDNIIQKKAFLFSLEVIKLFQELQKQKEFIISKQLLRSGTSIGANIEEAIGSESKKDFLHKMSISKKEAMEARYWLKLLQESNLTNIDVQKYLQEIENIINILVRITKTTSKKLGG